MLSRLSRLHFFIKSIDISDSGYICCYLGLCVGFRVVCWLVLDHHSIDYIDYVTGIAHGGAYSIQISKNS